MRRKWKRYGWLLAVLAAAAPAGAQQGPLEELPPAREVVPTENDGSEIVRERYPDGRVSIERQVALDENQNYVNHGAWTSFDPSGAKLVSGQYRWGQPHGMWTRWYRGHETPLLQELPYSQFKPPFVSQATFRDGELDGVWSIFDANQQKISEINFSRGRRSGPAVWWYPSGGKMRELAFVDNLLQGEATFYRTNGQVARRERYERGHKIDRLVQRHPQGGVESEGMFRYPQIVMISEDNWWQMELATFEVQGEGTKEGEWTVYYPNGQKRLVGTFKDDQPVGQFTWWHETGQRALAGAYDEGGSRRGEWTWWHPNGMKMTQGEFHLDSPRGMWASWDSEGNLLRQIDSFTGEAPEAIVSLPSPESSDERGVEELAAPGEPVASEEESLPVSHGPLGAGEMEEIPAPAMDETPPMIRRPLSPYSPLPELLHGN